MYYLVNERVIPSYTVHDERQVASWRLGTPQFSSQPVDSNYLQERREYYKSANLNLPKNYRVSRIDSNTSLHVVFLEVDQGLFLIKAPSQLIAYRVLDSMNGGFFYMSGDCLDFDNINPRLLDVRAVPQSSWTSETLFEQLKDSHLYRQYSVIGELNCGRLVEYSEMTPLGPLVERLYTDDDLSAALNHLGHSRAMFNGFMVGSYYEIHYRDEREDVTAYEMEKRFFENRLTYELAFLSAFKGIERFLGVNQIKRSNIRNLLIKADAEGVEPSSRHMRAFEIFSGLDEEISYESIIVHFLNIRNVVAAHSNLTPPEELIISEDTIREIQYFLWTLCRKSLDDIEPRKLPPRAVLNAH